MPKRKLHWHVFPSYLLLVLLSAIVVGWIAVRLLERSLLDARRADLMATADLLNAVLGPNIVAGDRQFAAAARRFDTASGTRVTLLSHTGKVASDSRGRPEELENQLQRPEIEQALAGRADDAVRYNAGLDQRVLYLAAPLSRDGSVAGALYFSTPLAELDQTVWQLDAWIAVTAVGLIVLAAVLAWRLGWGIAQPLEQIRQTAARLGNGVWNARASVPEPRELADLAEAFNRMADQWQRRIQVLTQSNNEQQAVLASMAEGVLAVDSQERLISMNTASNQLLGVDQATAQGRQLQEVVRNADLSRFVSRALACREPLEADILLHGDRERVMQARGSALHDLDGETIGAVIVLNDVTDFRRLEHIRRDFVANVSHELKTPVTSIKGFVETLLDGAMHDPVDSDRFLRIIAKQADRLHAIIEDLLSLSKIEQSEDAQDIVLEPVALQGVLESAIYAYQSGASEKQVEVVLDCPEHVTARVNPLLFEQAVGNLLDNAVKYSDAGRQIRVSAAESPDEVTVSVTDQGCGIASEHLARIFERFYRVDPARSRKLGGTGLGLAIVKHVAQAHQGRVTVESTLGAGSTFTIRLPRP